MSHYIKVTCDACGGSGKTFFGTPPREQTCIACSGSGFIVTTAPEVNMKLWLLRTVVQTRDWSGKANGFVVRAANESSARWWAEACRGGEGTGFWLDHDKATCVELSTDGQEGLIIKDFNRV